MKSTRLQNPATLITSGSLLLCLLMGGTGAAQVLKGSRPSPTANENHLVSSALSRSVLVTTTGAVPGSLNPANSELIGLLRRQSAAAHALLLPARSSTTPVAAQPGPLLSGSTQMLNPQPYPPKGSSPQIGAGQVMSAQGNSQTPNGAVSPNSGPMRQQPPSSPQPEAIASRAPQPTRICMPGIATVDGQKSGIWFSPVQGEEGLFVIQGCGFGTTAGEVSLTGIHYADTPERSATRGRFVLQSRDRVSFQITPNGWSDRQIVAQIDPNAGGLYDTNNVTLVVKTSTGQQYQAAGFNFSAAREEQVLTALPEPSGCNPQSSGPACVPIGVKLVTSHSAVGPVTPQVESPSMSLVQPGETIAVARETMHSSLSEDIASPLPFSGGLDTYQFQFASGFVLHPQHGVALRHASADSNYCQSVGGNFSTNGNWSVNYTSTTSFQIYWAEEGCWPKAGASSGNFLDYASVSAYALEITVLGPRGVSPWPSEAMRRLGTAPQPSQLLLQH